MGCQKRNVSGEICKNADYSTPKQLIYRPPKAYKESYGRFFQEKIDFASLGPRPHNQNKVLLELGRRFPGCNTWGLDPIYHCGTMAMVTQARLDHVMAINRLNVPIAHFLDTQVGYTDQLMRDTAIGKVVEVGINETRENAFNSAKAAQTFINTSKACV